jgi:EAL domain-containing protein (putative c-di-GMP-specific phosphodiesterase class I)
MTELGTNVSIDDVGTGWASLTNLGELPVHALKIDRVFVAGLGSSPTDDATVASIISLGQELDLEVVGRGHRDRGPGAAARPARMSPRSGPPLRRPVPPDELIASGPG